MKHKKGIYWCTFFEKDYKGIVIKSNKKIIEYGMVYYFKSFEDITDFLIHLEFDKNSSNGGLLNGIIEEFRQDDLGDDEGEYLYSGDRSVFNWEIMTKKELKKRISSNLKSIESLKIENVEMQKIIEN